MVVRLVDEVLGGVGVPVDEHLGPEVLVDEDLLYSLGRRVAHYGLVLFPKLDGLAGVTEVLVVLGPELGQHDLARLRDVLALVVHVLVPLEELLLIRGPVMVDHQTLHYL